jgi:hypothetical protein
LCVFCALSFSRDLAAYNEADYDGQTIQLGYRNKSVKNLGGETSYESEVGIQ